MIFHRRVSFQGDIVSLQSVPALFPSSDKRLNDALTKAASGTRVPNTAVQGQGSILAQALGGAQIFLLHDRLEKT